MQQILTRCLLALFLIIGTLSAQEHKDLGRMWTFENVPLDWFEKAYDFRPDQKWLDHAREASLRFGSGCSASFVSPRGLIMTNHHCGRSHVAKASPEGEDWLQDGYVAGSLAKEVKLKGLTVQQLVSMTDITKAMNEGCADLQDPDERHAKLADNRKAIMAKAKKEHKGLTAEIVTLYQGGMFQLYLYKIYDDIRLVAAPSLQAAKFGGDPDNFTYPRFSLDFTFVRAYENDKPANTKKHYFKWCKEGPKEGDTVFVTGNPGSTGRLDTVAQVEHMRDAYYPLGLKLVKSLLKRMNDAIAQNPAREKALRSRILSLENTRKAFQGYLDGLRKERVMKTKIAAEKAIRAIIDKDPKLKAKYAGAWDKLEKIAKAKTAAMKKEGFRSATARKLSAKEKDIAKVIGEAFFAVYGTSIPPDATFTLRLSDGVVKGFPMNGTIAPYFTSLYGLFARWTEFGGKPPFDLPEAWIKKRKELDLSTPVNLVSTCDIIGGNSGSPMINKDLEIVGLVFDGNIESLSNRFVFMDDIPRTVCVHPDIIILALRELLGVPKLADELQGKSKGYR